MRTTSEATANSRRARPRSRVTSVRCGGAGGTATGRHGCDARRVPADGFRARGRRLARRPDPQPAGADAESAGSEHREPALAVVDRARRRAWPACAGSAHAAAASSSATSPGPCASCPVQPAGASSPAVREPSDASDPTTSTACVGDPVRLAQQLVARARRAGRPAPRRRRRHRRTAAGRAPGAARRPPAGRLAAIAGSPHVSSSTAASGTPRRRVSATSGPGEGELGERRRPLDQVHLAVLAVNELGREVPGIQLVVVPAEVVGADVQRPAVAVAGAGDALARVPVGVVRRPQRVASDQREHAADGALDDLAVDDLGRVDRLRLLHGRQV